MELTALRGLRITLLAAFLAGAAILLGGPTEASACSGSPLFDARIRACGMQIETELTEVEWERGQVSLEEALTPERLRASDGSAEGHLDLQIWWERSPGHWVGWAGGRSVGLETLEPGNTYLFYTERPLSWAIPASRVGTPGNSVFDDAQVVSLYGHPGVEFMGALGHYTAEGAAAEAARVAAEYDALNGARDVIPALHLIASVAQASSNDGTYLGRMSLDAVDEYVEVTAAREQLLFIDVQIGWGDPLAEVQRYEQQLLQPHVHIALDPEFATRSDGVAPGQAIGALTAAQINQVQEYLAGLAAEHDLPGKVLVVHQFRDDMLVDPQNIAAVDGSDLVIDMDGFGPQGQKLAGYQRYANSDYAEYAGFKLFYEWDTPLFTPAEIQALEPPPDYVIYQ